jgi:hypothetical protein
MANEKKAVCIKGICRNPEDKRLPAQFPTERSDHICQIKLRQVYSMSDRDITQFFTLISPDCLAPLSANPNRCFKWVQEKKVIFQLASEDVDESIERPYYSISLASDTFCFSVTIANCCFPDVFKLEISKMLFFFCNSIEPGASVLDALLPLF